MKVTLQAGAKINLGLDVLRRRPDGYHDVRMVMQSINLCDTVTIEAIHTYDKAIKLPHIEIHTNNPDVPDNGQNIAYKAATLILDKYNITGDIKINIEKHIPVAAGLAGGSTDAAAVLKGINELFSLNISDEELMKLGLQIGADVPFCIFGGTALSEGIGERLTRIEGMPDCFILIAKPPINVSTKYVYENLHVENIKKHPDIDGLINAINTGKLENIAEMLDNILENVTSAKYPVIEELKLFMKNNGAIGAIMSGSGPTVFGIYDDENTARDAQNKLRGLNITDEIYVAGLL